VMQRQPSKGFEVLEEAGLLKLSFEAIIDRFPDEFSAPAVDASRARLEGRPLPQRPAYRVEEIATIEGEVPGSVQGPVLLDAEALSFVDGFRNSADWFHQVWLPRYRETTNNIAAALSDGRPQDLFETIWKRADNAVSNAGQGILKFDTVDKMRNEFIQTIRDIFEDGSPRNFEHVVNRFEGWKAEGRIGMVPRLLIARAFASVHPRDYHTTVDASGHNQALKWFVDRTGFVIPRSTNWAARARALVTHLDRSGVFGEDILLRNLFPWFVVHQLRARYSPADIPPGHSSRPVSAFADLPPAQRVIALRHNAVQTELFARLTIEFGEGRVWTEYPTGTGGYADAIVRRPDGRCYLYEIKIAGTATEVVRQAMGQLLEYSFREGGLDPMKMFVVGEPVLDDVTRRFLARLGADFKLDIGYLRVDLPASIDPS